MNESPFKIYNASAGSGKTHTLTKEYLKIILTSKGGYRQILALTFTNKAVDEMKSRILESLFEFSNTDSVTHASPLFLDVQKELDLDTEVLRKRAGETLKDILHNYAFFDVSTLDKFTHRLIRTFAKDLKIPQNFEVVLDKDLLLNEAVSRLILKAGQDPLLTEVLLDFALEKIEDDKSWDIGLDLIGIGGLLFEENHKKQLEKYGSKSIADFLDLKKLLKTRIAGSEAKMKKASVSALELIKENNLEFSDFSSSYFPKFMLKISNGGFDIDFGAKWKQNFDDAPLYAKKCDESTKLVLDSLHQDFSILFGLIQNAFSEYSLLRNAYRSIVPLTVLNSIQQEIKTLQEERDQLSISEFNTIISKEIKNQPAPFIYERLGEKYRHYFIDEFQDTSVMQWENLQPLIDNALAGYDENGHTGSLFLVGDTKQAIYRWRGGRAEQFLKLTSGQDNPFVIAPAVKMLKTNYRSQAEIIKFNNDFFQNISQFLNKPVYNALFVEGNKQLQNAKEGGYVEMRFLDEDDVDDKDDLYGNAVLETINKVDPKGKAYGDICILVRSNKHGVALADFLTQNKVQVISTESLLINSSEKVRFLIALLRYQSMPNDPAVRYEILSFLSKGKNKRHELITAHLNQLNTFLANTYGLDMSFMRKQSVYDGLELAIKQFDLAPDNDVYLISLLDTVLDVENKDGAGVQTFLEYWDKKKEKLSLSAPATSNAVRIMTIHKAKGLEFPVVIFPYANEDIYRRFRKNMWLPVDPEDFNGFSTLLISEKKEVLQYGAIAAERYTEEEQKMELDAFNLLYVALTRAEKALFIISKKEIASNGAHNASHYSGLFIHYLKEKGLWDGNQEIYGFGTFSRLEETSLRAPKSVPFQYTFKNRPGFSILAAAGSLWDTERETAIAQGNLIHTILSHVETKDDVEAALAFFSRRGDIPPETFQEVRDTINKIVAHPQLKPYYKEGLIVKNEKDIITQKGKLLRPDRLVFEGNEVTVIDYKTGKGDPTYHQQLYEYADALEEMGYLVARKIIVYSNTVILPEFI
ncbi:ATP-dependent helicase [Aggregatimonas sangjinii]|uniref:DNA 3'-5' helicase n=1 Tax=Aggregatimonas sangjinii TaxID=2583587 RepID=A0A5B7SV09_9FLAO|nr:UvrD-helicase domain-containing protein [Aggregatimonas sangjinii]QCX02042.1 ATP-dependent helicase [Aggregatimonas sangjinii]